MAGTTQGIGLNTYDLTTDNGRDFVTGMSENMVDIDTAITDKVKVNDIPSNVNLISSGETVESVNGKKFASNTDIVKDRTGRTVDTINRVFYKQNCKEFTSSGETITVNNGMDGYLLQAKIEGRTVNNIFDHTKKREERFYYNGWNQYLENGYIRRKPKADNQTIAFAIKIPEIVVGNTYTVLVDILYNGLIGKIVSGTSSLTMPIEIPEKGTGVYVYSVVATDSNFQVSIGSKTPMTLANDSEYIILRISVFEGDVENKINSYLPFGLSSTKAIVSNNGLKYSF